MVFSGKFPTPVGMSQDFSHMKEYGDFTDIVITKLPELYPPSVVLDPSTFKLNVEERTQLCDQIIEALDEGLRAT